MLDTILKIVSILSASVNIITKAAEVLQKAKDKHQKSNRPARIRVAFLI